MLTSAVEALGQIDIAVTCAGVALWKPALEVPEEEFDRVFAVNVKGTWLVAQAVARHMVGRGVRGSIITISSDVRTAPRRTWPRTAAPRRPSTT